MTPSEILMKHEDANEYHFHEVDRKWIIEAMEEYATISKRETVDKEKSVIPINLYTEEQVRKAALFSLAEDATMDKILDLLTPIELPSDEEIEKKADEYVENKWEYAQDECKETFTDCAKWLRDKILNQNK